MSRPTTVLLYLFAFLVGCAAILVPAFYQASVIHADETMRGEQTMSPGIHVFVGILFTPLGGLVAIGLLHLARKR